MKKKYILNKVVNTTFIISWIAILVNIIISFFMKESISPEILGDYIIINWTVNGTCLLVIFVKAYTNVYFKE